MHLTVPSLERLVVCISPLPGCKDENLGDPYVEEHPTRDVQGSATSVHGDLLGLWHPQLSPPQLQVLSSAVDLKDVSS